MASLDFCPVVLQLAWLFSSLACSMRVQLLVACKPRASREIQPRVPTSLHSLEYFFTLSHTLLLHDSHLNTGLLIAKIQANLAWNKANKMVDKIQLYTRQSDSRIQLACQLFSKLGSMHFFPNPLTNSQKSTNCFYHRLMDWWYCVHLHSEVLS